MRFTDNSHKTVYGYILVDNLEPEIALESISLPTVENVALGKTLKLTPTFSPVNTTHKIVKWSSSDETVATVDNDGNITPKKIGSTIITVTSQDGKKKATCTVTVVSNSGNNNSGTSAGGTGTPSLSGSVTGGTNNNGTQTGNAGSTSTNNGNSASSSKDKTTAVGKLPQTGVGVGIVVAIISIIGIGIFSYSRIRAYRDI